MSNGLGGALLETIGRLHPSLVHLPIGLVIAAAMVEVWRALQRRPGVSGFTTVALALGAAFAVIAASTGWIFAESERETSDLFWHRWLGIAGAAMLIPLAVTAVRASVPGGRKSGTGGAGASAQLWPLVRGGTIGAAVLLGVVGHLGGTMVWGNDWYFAPLKRALKQGESERDAKRSAAEGAERGAAESAERGAKRGADRAAEPVRAAPGAGADDTARASRQLYVGEVLPLLVERCNECHFDGKHKGDLALDDPEQLVGMNAAGDWIVRPGHPDDSELLRRISLPESNDDAMPPKGARLTAEQIASVRKWIESGAVTDSATVATDSATSAATSAAASASATNASANPPANGSAKARAAGAVSAVTAPTAAAPPLTSAANDAIAALRKIGVVVQPLSQRDGWLEVNASSRAKAFGDAELAQVRPLAAWVVELNVARTAVTDAGVRALPALPALAVARLDGTTIGDGAVAALLEGSPALQVINLVGTAVTDSSAARLKSAPRLARVYLWQTAVTTGAIAELRAAHPEASIDSGETAPPAVGKE